MALPNKPKPLPVLRFAGIIAGNDAMLAAARQHLSQCYGPMDDQSEIIDFNFTAYYEDQMGTGLLRQWVRFATLCEPQLLAQCKLETNRAEVLLAGQFPGAAPRPINIDPGYVSRTKVILATTKDHSHRVYLGEGIFAEVTLHWTATGWAPWPWTYADYRTPTAQEFFLRCREAYVKQLPAAAGAL